MKKIHLILIVLLSFCLNLNAQKTTSTQPMVKGEILDENGLSLPGATIKIENGESVLSDENGEFNFPFSEPVNITVSSVGYASKTVRVTDPDVFLSITMDPGNVQELEEVAVTALGLSKKTRAIGYAITEVSGDAVQQAKESNFVNSLQGKLAGVQILGNTGSMGGSTKVTVRGNKSITGDNNALYVVDGVIMSNQNLNSFNLQNMNTGNQAIGGGGYDYGSPIQDINPDDIESISVLKGASATALYGSRGSNGVVLITTKKGTKSKRLGITYNTNFQIDKISYLPNFQNRYGGGGAVPNDPNFEASTFDTLWVSDFPDLFPNGPTYNDQLRGGYDLIPSFGVDESWGPEMLGQVYRPYYSFDQEKGNPYFGVTSTWSPQPNNVRDFYETGHTFVNSVSIGGGDEKGSFRASFNNFTQDFVMPNSKLNRNNVGLNGNRKLGKKLTVVGNANYSVTYARGRSGTGFDQNNPMQLLQMFTQRQLEMDKLAFWEYSDGSQVTWNRTAPDNPRPLFATTPYWHAYRDYEDDKRTRLWGLAGLDYNPIDWIKISGRIFMDEFSTRVNQREAKDYIPGSYARTDFDHREINYQLIATGRRNLTEKLSLDFSAGGNIMVNRDKLMRYSYTGLITPLLYTLTNNAGAITVNEQISQKRINSLFASGTLGYNNILFLDITGRNDWSSTLPKGNNSYFYPGTALSFVFSDLMKEQSWLSFGKLRLSYAKIGSDTDPYRTMVTYNPAVQYADGFYIFRNPQLGNSELKPEISHEAEVGTELKFFDDRLGIDLSYYNRITKDLIIPLTVTNTSGYTNFFANAGKSRNRGVELQLTGAPVKTQDFVWQLTLNMSANRSKLLSLDIPNNPDIDRYIIGTERRRRTVSTAAVVGYPMFVLLGTDYTYLNGEKVMTSSGQYVPSPGGQVIGNTEPKFIGGFNNSFRYKNLVLSALIDFQKGGSFFSYTNLYGMASGTLEESVANDVRKNGVDVEGVDADGNHMSVHVSAPFHFKNNFGNFISTANLYDATFVYLREVRLGYKLPEKWADAIQSGGISVTFYGRNLWLIHRNAPNVDPSNILNSTSNITGMEGGALPPVRSYGINISVTF